jgi:thymidylate synthase (FAD)
MQKIIVDPYFDCGILAATPNPNRLVFQALRQDYSEGDVLGAFDKTEQYYGEQAIKLLLHGGKGHFGPLEHPQITLNVVGFPHDVSMQLRTHRVGTSFDIQSSRYTGERFVWVAEGRTAVEQVFYARPVGQYADRNGHNQPYTAEMREEDLAFALESCKLYKRRVDAGIPPEAARQFVVQGFRQNFVMSVNARSLMHLLDLRSKADAQPECQAAVDLLFREFKLWMPEIAGWYEETRLKKARLAP